MLTHDFKQGDPAWHAHRATHFNASDAPAMLGCSPYMTRAQLLHRLHTGLSAEVDPATQRRFDDGHRFEALARPIAEKIIGEELYPVTGSEGELSASFDGLTMMGDTAFEHKTLNDELRSLPWDQGNGYFLPKHYRVQMEQQLLVSGAERVLFMASKWEDGEALVEERHCWYASDPALRAEIVAGWKQFAADLAAYKPTEAAAPVTAAPIEALPALSVQMQGSLAVHSNLDLFGAKLRTFVEQIPAKPESDQEFADCAAAVKALEKAEEALNAAEANALGQVASVEQLTRTIATLREVSATARKATSRMVEDRKKQIRLEQVQRGQKALAVHIAGLNDQLGKPYMPAVAADFAGAISGKKTVDSVRNAIDTELARCKIAANEVAGTIQTNLRWLRENAADYAFLFADTGAIVLKAPDDLQALATNRINAHKQAEEKRLADIRAEEQAKAEKAAREKLEAEQRAAAAAELAASKAKPEGAELSPAAQVLNEREGAQRFADSHRGLAPAAAPIAQPAVSSPVANVVPMPTRAPTANEPTPTIRLGQIGEKLGFPLTADFIAQLGFHPVATEKSAKLYRLADVNLIIEALMAHLRTVQQLLKQAA